MAYLQMILALLALSSAPAPSSNETVTAVRKPVACQFFTPELAAKLLGQKQHGVDDEKVTNDGGHEWICTFSSASESGPKIHFLLMKSPSEDVAKQAFEEIRQSNKNHKGSKNGREFRTKQSCTATGRAFILLWFAREPKRSASR